MHFQEARIFRRVKADDIAEVAGVSCSTISAWQQGSREPNPAQKRVVAAALAMDPRQITYGPPPGGFTRRNIHPSKMRTLDEVAKLAANEAPTPGPAAKTKTRRLAAKAAARDEAEATEVPLIKGRIEPNGQLGITGGTFEVVSGPAPEAFDSSTWSVIRRMIETIGVDEAIRRLMLAR
jgi:transcriptional regulator with XRE-family HTH domain